MSIHDFMDLMDRKRIEITFPVRENDCPAAPVCEAVGNLRESCCKGGDGMSTNTQKCMAGLILLISGVTGNWSQEMTEHVEQRRKIGFVHQEDDHQDAP